MPLQVDTRHRKVGLENLAMAFGDRYTEAERDRIVRGVYLHFCMMIMEILHTPRKIHLTNWRAVSWLVGHEPMIDRLHDRRRPMILLTGHYGNWELAGYLFGLFGFPTVLGGPGAGQPVSRSFSPLVPRADRPEADPQDGGLRPDARGAAGQPDLSFLADQDAGQRGLYVDFFGQPASTHKAIALLAIEHQAPVVVGVARRVGPGFRYEIRCDEVIEPAEFTGTADDVRLLTQRYTSALERLIRQDPTQYLWLHRRWKHQPQAKLRRECPGGDGRIARVYLDRG